MTTADSAKYRVVIQEAYANARRILIDFVPWLVYELPPGPYRLHSSYASGVRSVIVDVGQPRESTLIARASAEQ